MKNIITSLLLVVTISAFAQTGIGTTTPNANAQLDVASTTKGFLPPRVALTSTTSASPLASHVAGMVVYNTATVSDVTPGLYVNNGSVWEKQAGGGGASSINDLSDGKTINSNVFLGSDAGNAYMTGNYNVGVGVYSNFSNSSGSSNTSLGSYSLTQNYYGSSNVAIGFNALASNTGINSTTFGSNNTALGYSSLINNSNGSNNVSIGSRSGQLISSGPANLDPNNSIYIGNDTRALASSGTNEIVIGDQAVGHGSNTIRLGNASIISAHIKVAWTVTSDARDKNKFAPLDRGLDFITQLKPYSYEFRKNRDTEETDGIKRYGFKAQDIEALENGDFVIVDNKDPEHLKLKETALIPVLVKAVQELEKENAELKNTLNELKTLVEGLAKK